jgi:hypothetical protein
MSKVKETKKKLKSKIEVIKKINDNPKSISESLYDKYLDDLPTADGLYGKKVDDFLDKRKNKIDNRKNILDELIDVAEGFLSSNKKINSSDNLSYKNRIKQHSLDSARVVLSQSKEIILDNVKKIFFVGDGICGTNKTISGDTAFTLDPKEFDFLNMLTINPQSSMGKVVYESNKITGKEKVNKNIYDSFLNPNGYTFTSNSDIDLFTMTWDSNNQHFNVTDFSSNVISPNVEDFLNDYYSSVELPDIQHIIKNAMLLTIQGDGSETPLFNKSLNDLDRLTKKLFSICGTSTKREDLENISPVDLFDENDQDLEFYFNFEDVEGIDLDDEDNRFRKVMKFSDCNNFEVPINTTIINDFTYLSDKRNMVELVNETLSRTATNAYVKSDSSIPQINFNISLIKGFVQNVPKAIVMSVLSPKIILPIIMVSKMFNPSQIFEDVKLFFKKFAKLFLNIISDLFWLFIRSFWKLIKVDLLSFVSQLVRKIILNKYKRNVSIITSLITLLTKILESGIDNCEDLFGTLLGVIEVALSAKTPFIIPGLLLSLSDRLPGYSQDRALLNISERLESYGISLGPIYGEENKIPLLIKSIIDGNTEEMDTNSFVKIVLKPSILPGPTGGAVVPPGVITGVGKWI